MRDGPDAHVETELEAMGDGRVFVMQTSCMEVPAPRARVVGRARVKPSAREGISELRESVFRTQSTRVGSRGQLRCIRLVAANRCRGRFPWDW